MKLATCLPCTGAQVLASTGAWEFLWPRLQTDANPRITFDGKRAVGELKIRVEQTGRYRLHAATTDLASRSTVVWPEIIVRQ